jgi:hypothetical protein
MNELPATRRRLLPRSIGLRFSHSPSDDAQNSRRQTNAHWWMTFSIGNAAEPNLYLFLTPISKSYATTK